MSEAKVAERICMGLDCHKRDTCQLFLKIRDTDAVFIEPDCDFGPEETVIRCRDYEGDN